MISDYELLNEELDQIQVSLPMPYLPVQEG